MAALGGRGRDCRDARQEVLVEESLEPVTFETDRKCRLEWGRWWAPHLQHHLENPRHIDVDHHVPLKNAHLSGGWNWDAERKERYANDLANPAHLVAISARHNRSKGARGPEEWAPPDNDLWCDYATDWTQIKERWGLTMTSYEAAIVMDMLGTCEDPPKVRGGDTGLMFLNNDSLRVLEQGGDYFWVLKDNQPGVKEAVSLLFEQPPWGESFVYACQEGRRGTGGKGGDCGPRRP